MDSPEVKAVVGFGTQAARSGATPKAIQIAYRVLIFLQGLYALIESNFNIPQHQSYLIMKWTALGVTLIYFICQQFGWTKPTASTDKTTEV